MTTALAVRSATLPELERTAKLYSESGLFTDVRGMAQCFVKIDAGRTMGFDPYSSMTGIHIIKGKPTVGAHLIAAKIKASGKYNYKILEKSAKQCRIEFFEGGESVGVEEFTMADAAAAELRTDMWKKYPKNMLYSRCISNGYRAYCPDVLHGVLAYTPEEMGADIDAEGNVVVETTAVEVTQCEHTNKYAKLAERATQRGIAIADLKAKWDEFSNNRFGATLTPDAMDADGFIDVYKNAVAWCQERIADIEALAAADAAQSVEEAAEADLLEATI